jgi:hypothetical protein
MEVKDLKVLQHIHTLKILLGCEEHLTEKFSKSNSLVQLCSLCHKSTLNKISSSKKQNVTQGYKKTHVCFFSVFLTVEWSC